MIISKQPIFIIILYCLFHIEMLEETSASTQLTFKEYKKKLLTCLFTKKTVKIYSPFVHAKYTLPTLVKYQFGLFSRTSKNGLYA